MRRKLLCGAALLAMLSLAACNSGSAVPPNNIPSLHTESTDTGLDSGFTADTTAAPIQTTLPSESSGTVSAAGSSLLSSTGITSSAAVSSLTTASASSSATTASSASAQTNTTLSTVTTLTTTAISTTTVTVTLQQNFAPIAGEWYIDGEPSKGKAIIAASGVFTTYDGNNKVTAVGQAKHEYVINSAGVQEIRYNLYNKFGGKIVVSVLDTGAASYSQLVSTVDNVKTYYLQKGMGFKLPDEATRTQIVVDALAVVDKLETLASGDVVIDTADLLPSNSLYNKVIIAPVKSAQEIRKLLDDNLSGLAKARYNGIVSGDMPHYLDAGGAFYAIPVGRKADFHWKTNTVQLGNTSERMFMASVQYFDANNASQTAELTFRFENNSWKLAAID